MPSPPEPSLDRDHVTQYTRQDVLRILHLKSRHLVAWERESLIPAIGEGEFYSFAHLSRLRALREMHSKRTSARSIRAQVDAMQRVSGMSNALAETSAVRQGSRLSFRQAGALVDPCTQQLAFDFDLMHHAGLQVALRGSNCNGTTPQQAVQVQEIFLKAVQLEESASRLPEAIALYESILQRTGRHAPACINLGTIFYNQREFARAEEMYRRATEADPHYALAFFDLGNVLDEMQRLEEAIAAYQRAILIVPGYADAHYNLALAYERLGERRRALRHWTTYVRLDPVGPWALHARGQAKKILSMEKLSLVSRHGHKVPAAG